MKRSYLGAVLGEEGSYGIVFRDFPGCVSSGASLEHVVRNGKEALQGHVETMFDAGEGIPDASKHSVADVAAWLSDPDDPLDEPIAQLVPIDIVIPEAGDMVTLRIKADWVQKIADMATETATRLDSRQFIERAVQDALDRSRKAA